MLVGALPDIVEDQFAAPVRCRLGLRGSRPASRRDAAMQVPAVGPSTRYLLAQPFLADTGARAGAPRSRSASPPRPARRGRHDALAGWPPPRRFGIGANMPSTPRDRSRRHALAPSAR